MPQPGPQAARSRLPAASPFCAGRCWFLGELASAHAHLVAGSCTLRQASASCAGLSCWGRSPCGACRMPPLSCGCRATRSPVPCGEPLRRSTLAQVSAVPSLYSLDSGSSLYVALIHWASAASAGTRNPRGDQANSAAAVCVMTHLVPCHVCLGVGVSMKGCVRDKGQRQSQQVWQRLALGSKARAVRAFPARRGLWKAGQVASRRSRCSRRRWP